MTSSTSKPPFADEQVAIRFDAYSGKIGKRLLALRKLIHSTAANAKITDLTETLKWNEPAWLCRSGSTLRIDHKERLPDHYGLFFNCQTTLLSDVEAKFGPFTHCAGIDGSSPQRSAIYEGNRALFLPLAAPLPRTELGWCIEQTLSYKTRRRARKNS